MEKMTIFRIRLGGGRQSLLLLPLLIVVQLNFRQFIPQNDFHFSKKVHFFIFAWGWKEGSLCLGFPFQIKHQKVYFP